MKPCQHSRSSGKLNQVLRFGASLVASLALVGGIDSANANQIKSVTAKQISSASVQVIQGRAVTIVECQYTPRNLHPRWTLKRC